MIPGERRKSRVYMDHNSDHCRDSGLVPLRAFPDGTGSGGKGLCFLRTGKFLRLPEPDAPETGQGVPVCFRTYDSHR